MTLFTSQSPEFWEKRLTGNEPQRVQNAIKRIYAAYPPECLPMGICDPMYIMNVICKELGVGDGCGNFTLSESDNLPNPKVACSTRCGEGACDCREAYFSKIKGLLRESITGLSSTGLDVSLVTDIKNILR